MRIIKAVGEWFDLYQKMVYGYLIGLCGSKELAEELTQETFYQALKSLNRFREDSSPSTWLCGIARNLFIQSSEGARINLSFRRRLRIC